MKKAVGYLLVFLILMFTITCGSNTGPSVATIEWEPDGNGFRQFRTNDPTWKGWTFWYYLGGSYQATMSTVETEVKKVSGSSAGGLGLIFCFQDHDNFYVYGINVNGDYAVFERYGGSWYTIIDWTYSADVYTGFNVLNTLKVTYNGIDTFTLYVNGIEIDSFTDSDFSGGYSGYECYISSSADFPEIAEDFRFNQLLPSTNP